MISPTPQLSTSEVPHLPTEKIEELRERVRKENPEKFPRAPLKKHSKKTKLWSWSFKKLGSIKTYTYLLLLILTLSAYTQY